MTGIVGREPELGVIDEVLAAAGAGPSQLVIVGEPGIGKTTVWRAALDRARGLGGVVLLARPAQSEAKLAFAGLTDLLGGVDDQSFAVLPSPQRDALAAALLRAQSTRVPGRRLLGTALGTLLQELAAAGPVIVAVDDAQWLDSASASVLEFALRRVDGPVRLLVSLRADATQPSFVLQEARRLELGPLTVAALQRIISERLQVTFPRPTLVRLAEASRGNAFYALEIARLLSTQARHDVTAPLPVPEDLRLLVTRRIAALPQETQRALLCAAAAARPTAAAVDLEALVPAERAGLVTVDGHGAIRFAHPLFESAVYASASARERAAAHRELAAVAAELEERARHLALASPDPDESTARALTDAAGDARRRGAPDAAAELIELAVARTPATSDELPERRLALADAWYLAGDLARAGTLAAQLADDLDGGDLRARALITLSDVEYWRVGESSAVEVLEAALRDAVDPLLRARCHAAIATYAGTSDLAKAADAARGALALLETVSDPDPALVAFALSARVRADLFLGQGFDRAAAVRAAELEAGAPSAVVDERVTFKLGQWLRYVDDLDGARKQFQAAEREAADEGDESSLANICLNRSILECWQGDWQLAAELARSAHTLFALAGVSDGAPDIWLAYVDAHAGRIDAVRAAAPVEHPEPIRQMLWERSLGLAALAVGDVRAADAHLSVALDTLAQTGFEEPAVWRLHGDAIEAAVAVGALERAGSLLDSFEKSAETSRIPWSLAVSARCRGLLLAASGEQDEAAAALDRALEAHESCPVPFELARTLLAQGQVFRRGRRKLQARAALEQSATLFEELGGAPWAVRARDELRRTAVRSAPDELTPTELRIAHLAATGLTNDAIASEVFVTRKTVEANLGRAYRKLGISSRAQLARALDALSIS